ncbi:fatty acid desaturase [Roseovarius aestuarii]|uniref:Fatty acid desaturase n=1 Tax=Roseovarius aestuarii TaxID=475083 RepID=A0A1X7BPF4_9RHOB|nr:fatty acid desaturase [Roseovarius aestuarii]SMC11420.1 Fatty acid desaturase [Roseovarius aestuarii]
MDHKAFIASLPADTLADLNRRDDAPGLRHLAGHAALITGFGLWIALGLPLWQVALVGQGIAICFLFTLEHEATHKTPFADERLSEWVGRICGVLIALPFEWFRYFHLAHHRHTNVPGKDPELMAGAKPDTIGTYIVHVTGIPFWVDMLDRIIGSAFGRDPGDFVPERAHRRVMVEARWMLLIYGLTVASLFVTPLLFWVWLLPCLLGQPFLRLYLLAEHGRCAFVANMFENTRTTYTNRIIHFLAWNMPYHVEHHTLPQVPFHRLPDLHVHMQGRHKVTSDGYLRFTGEYLNTLKQPLP